MSNNNTTTPTTSPAGEAQKQEPVQLSPQAEYVGKDIQRIQKQLSKSVLMGLVGGSIIGGSAGVLFARSIRFGTRLPNGTYPPELFRHRVYRGLIASTLTVGGILAGIEIGVRHLIDSISKEGGPATDALNFILQAYKGGYNVESPQTASAPQPPSAPTTK